MKRLKEYISQPTTRIKIIVVIFSCGIVRANLNNRIGNIEKEMGKVNILEISVRLSSIEKDIQWIKLYLQEKK